MKVARWGNSLAVRLPRSLIEELELKDGDEVDLRPAGGKTLDVVPDRQRREALDRIASLRRPLPEGYRFDRAEVYDRLGPDSPGRMRDDD